MRNCKQVLVLFIVYTVIDSVLSQKQCTTPNNDTGLCVSFTNCETFTSVWLKRTPDNIKFFKASYCGFNGSAPLVCCGIYSKFLSDIKVVQLSVPEVDVPKVTQSSSSTVSTLSTERKVEDKGSETTTLISVILRPIIAQLWTTKMAPVTPSSTKSLFEKTTFSPELFTSAIVVDSFETTPKLFTTKGVGDEISDKSNGRMHRNLHLLPTRGACGIESIKDKIAGGEEADLEDFPWLALLLYNYDENNITLNCGGSIINKRYILTAAHCIVRKEKNLVSVRLGEHNTETEVDCVDSPYPDEEPICAPPYQQFKIEKMIYHEQYSPRFNRRNDIGLLRLDKDIVYNGFVKPICLPLTGEGTIAGKNLTVAGFGLTEKNTTSTIKLKVNLPLWTRTGCKEVYAIGFNVKIGKHQFCAGGRKGKDSCTADSGGPLIQRYPDNVDYYQEGIVSFGPVPCGRQATPGVYVNTSMFIDWILDNMEPF